MAAVETDAPAMLPKHLRDGHYKGAEAFGHVGHKFPHGDPRGWVKQDYVQGLRPGPYYQSDARGEANFGARAAQFWEETTGARQTRAFGK